MHWIQAIKQPSTVGRRDSNVSMISNGKRICRMAVARRLSERTIRTLIYLVIFLGLHHLAESLMNLRLILYVTLEVLC